MVIYDTKNNFNGKIKGMLYLSAYDVDYLLTKYGAELKKKLPEDYTNIFDKEISKREKEDRLSVQWYAMLSLGIETDKDEELLKVIAQEISEGNMLTRKQLQSLSEAELDKKIKEFHLTNGEYSDYSPNLSPQEIYKIRSYYLSKTILDSMDDANKKIDSLNNDPDAYYKEKYKQEIALYLEELKHLGADGDIVDSDYFETTEQGKEYKMTNEKHEQ